MSEVTAVVTTYNSEDTVHRAINSVLAQTIDCEIIVVDDASTDDTIERLQEYKSHPNIEIIQHDENQGGSAARNTGIRNSTTEYIALLDGDDLWKPTKLEEQLSRIKEDDAAVAVYCDYSRVLQGVPKARDFVAKVTGFHTDEGEETRPEGGEELIPQILSMSFDLGGSSTLLFKRAAAYDIGGFDERFPRHQDWEFLIRLLKQGKLVHVDKEMVVKYEDGLHSIESVKEAKRLFLSKFEDEIEDSEKTETEIYDAHYRHLGMVHFQNAGFIQGFRYLLKKNELTADDLPYSIWSISIGIYTKTSMLYSLFNR